MNTLKKILPVVLTGIIATSCGSKDKNKETPATSHPTPDISIADAQISGDLVTVKFSSSSEDVSFKCKVDKVGQAGTWEACGPSSFMFLLGENQSNLFSVKSINADQMESGIASQHFTAIPAQSPVETPADEKPAPETPPAGEPGTPGTDDSEPGIIRSGPEGDFAGAIFLARNGMCEIRYGNDTELVECNSYFNQQQCSMAINLSFPKMMLKNPPICLFQGTGCYSLNQGVRPQIANMSNVQIDVVFSGLPQPRHLCDDLGQIAIFQCKISE